MSLQSPGLAIPTPFWLHWTNAYVCLFHTSTFAHHLHLLRNNAHAVSHTLF
jgi:hypothetical protein